MTVFHGVFLVVLVKFEADFELVFGFDLSVEFKRMRDEMYG